MILNEREIKILEKFYNKSELSIYELAKEFNVSERMIRYNIDRINDVLSFIRISPIKKSSKGTIILNIEGKENKILEIIKKLEPLDKNKKITIIQWLILFSKEKITITYLTKYFDLSRGELMTSSLVTNTFSSNSTRTSIVKKTSNGDIYIQLSSEMFTPSILGLSGETITTTEEDGSEKEQVNYSPWIYITVGNENDKYSTNGILSSSTYKFTTDGEAAIGRVKKEDVDGKISYSPWININSNEAILSAGTYQFKSDKTATIGPIVLNNDGTISIGNYTIDTKGNLNIGHIKIHADGTATIGSGEYQATIDADGKFQIPEKCIIKENI